MYNKNKSLQLLTICTVGKSEAENGMLYSWESAFALSTLNIASGADGGWACFGKSLSKHVPACHIPKWLPLIFSQLVHGFLCDRNLWCRLPSNLCKVGGVGRDKPLTSALRRQTGRWICCKFKASLAFREIPRTAKATEKHPLLRPKKRKKKKKKKTSNQEADRLSKS